MDINIKKGQGLSQAIDTKLDEHFQKDVNINKLADWQSIFNLIKNDPQKPLDKFQNDNDITNNKQFVVHTGESYKITQNVWNKILEIANKYAQKEDNTQQTKTDTNQHDTKEIKNHIDTVLKEQNINIDKESDEYQDIVTKYQAIKSLYPNIKEEDLTARISNLARAIEFHKQETKLAQICEHPEKVDDIKLFNKADMYDDKNKVDLNKLKQVFMQKAKEFIELYDDGEGDGKISFEELKNFEFKDVTKNNNVEMTQEVIDMSLKALQNAFNNLNQNNDKYLDKAEISAYLWAMSKALDGKTGQTSDTITREEYVSFTNSLFEKDTQYSNLLKNGYDAFK